MKKCMYSAGSEIFPNISVLYTAFDMFVFIQICINNG